MTIWTSACEGANGATANAAALGCSQVSGSATFTNTRAHRGSTSLSGTGFQAVNVLNVSKFLDRGFIYFAAAATVDTTVGAMYSAGVRGVQFILSGGKKARLQYQGSGTLTTAATDTNDIPVGQWVRWELYGEASTTGSDGKARLALYADDSTTPIYDSGLITGINTAGTTGLFEDVRQNCASSFNLDDIGYKSGTDAVWGAWPSNAPPSVTVSPAVQSVTAGSAFAVAATATDDGSISSYAWTVLSAQSTATPTLTGAATANVSGTAPTAGNVTTLQVLVTDDGGLTATATSELRSALAGSATAVPLAWDGTSKVGTWTRAGAATTDGAALADALDTTYLETGTLSATEQSARFRMQPSATRSSGKFTLRLGTDTGAATALVRLYEGNTLRQSWSQAITGTATDYDFTFASGTLTAVTDWGNLYLGVGFTS